ncbi:hypothetical protein Hanom_Chr12g01083691 [Helianthus anomalus]
MLLENGVIKPNNVLLTNKIKNKNIADVKTGGSEDSNMRLDIYTTVYFCCLKSDIIR